MRNLFRTDTPIATLSQQQADVFLDLLVGDVRPCGVPSPGIRQHAKS
jgi:hypothetical protein